MTAVSNTQFGAIEMNATIGPSKKKKTKNESNDEYFFIALMIKIWDAITW